jgi:hypothetical protein
MGSREVPFHHRAVPIVLAAVLIDTIGFGIVMPVLPDLIVRLAALLLIWLGVVHRLEPAAYTKLASEQAPV